MSDISVIICTHNPRPDYLRRVLEALKSQTLPKERWELVLVDNASSKRLDLILDVSWHPNSVFVREEELGLTAARLCGIREAKGILLVFVDDDNVLAQDYLAEAWHLSEKWPTLGAWGCRYIPEFEVAPPEWSRRYWPMLCLGNYALDRWSNCWNSDCVPAGAGLCVRRRVAEAYVELVETDPRRRSLDRKGASLVSGGDSDLAMTACDLWLGVGKFSSLSLTHLIPSERLEERYFERLAKAMAYSSSVLHWLRTGEGSGTSLARYVVDLLRILPSPARQRRIRLAALKGKWRAHRFIRHNVLSTKLALE